MKKRSIKKSQFNINYKKTTLDNGLQVIFHKDTSNPVVAVAILYHVGSAREVTGKTGFAHFFEHMMFQRSEHIKRNEFFTRINDLGGTFNGGTWEDGTIYYESVPNDSLERILWMESDRMGYFINTVTKKGLEREIDVVINEKRQVQDNAPYGHTNYVILKSLYPEGHPYAHTVIGETDDLKKSNVGDVKDFYNEYYKPNNATLVISGDIRIDSTLKLVKKYFGEIKAGKDIPTMKVKKFKLKDTKKVYYEDKFIKMPELNIVYQGVEMYHKDLYALNILTDLLCNNKNSPIYNNIVNKYKYAPSVSMSCNPREHTGEVKIRVRTFPEISLQDVYKAIEEGMKDFENIKIDEKEIENCKTIAETAYYANFSSNLYKSLTIAEANVFGGSPEMISQELNNILSVTKQDIIDVYNKYIKDAKFVATSFVPVDNKQLALEGSVKATVKEESIESQTTQSEAGTIIDDEPYDLTPSKLDRTIEPKLSRLHSLKIPDIWHTTKFNGISVSGITDKRLPLVYFAFTIKAGTIYDKTDKNGTAYFTSKLIRERTASMNSDELETAIRNLGATIVINTYKEWTILSGNCLNKNFDEVVKIIEDILTNPSWDIDTFEKVKKEIRNIIMQASVSPQKIAEETFRKAVFGAYNPLSKNVYGDLECLENITIEDIKEYYESYYSPTICDFSIVGNITEKATIKSLMRLNYSWKPTTVKIPDIGYAVETDNKKINHVEYKDLQQSIIFMGNNSITREDPDYIKARLVNYKLGESSASVLFNVLRLQHGYTYGAYSVFNAFKSYGTFIAFSSVQASVTKEALALFEDIFTNYKDNYTEDDLYKSKFAVLRKYATKFETFESLLTMLIEISTFNFKDDYITDEMRAIADLSHKEALNIIDKYINFKDMKIVLVGDMKAIKPALTHYNQQVTK